MISVCEWTEYYVYVSLGARVIWSQSIDHIIHSKNNINRIEKMETEWLQSQKVQSKDGIDMIFTDAPTSMTVVPILYYIIIVSPSWIIYYKIILSLYDYNLRPSGLWKQNCQSLIAVENLGTKKKKIIFSIHTGRID